MRIIGHLDMDAFFAAVEEKEKPWLQGLPLVVGADPEGGFGRGVVSTANYKAREYGIHSALPIRTAWRYSEEHRKKGGQAVVFLTPSHENYVTTSNRIMKILSLSGVPIEQTSIDEAYFDLSEYGSFGSARHISLKIKKEINKREKLTATVGIGPNKLIAKIASDFKKPDGLTVVGENEVLAFLAPFSTRAIPGIGPKAEEIFRREGVRTIEDLRRKKEEELVTLFGEMGKGMYFKARGIDDTPLGGEREARSIGEQETFRKDTLDMDELLKKLVSLSHSVYKRFKRERFISFRAIVLTVRFHDFETKTRSYTSKDPLTERGDIELHATQMLMSFFDRRENPEKKQIRLLGVRIEKFAL